MKNRKTAALNPLAYLRKLAIAFVASCVIFMVIDFFAGRPVLRSGIVVEKLFKPEIPRLVQKSYKNKKGKICYYMVVEKDPATWTLYVQSMSGEVVRVDCSPAIFYTHQQGKLVSYIIYQGKWTHMPYILQATNKPTHTNEKDTQTTRNQETY